MRSPKRVRRARALASTITLTTATVLATGATVADAATDDPVPFACDPGFYQVIAGQFAEFDPGAGTYTRVGEDLDNYNAIGYRQADGLIYGVGAGNVYRIDATGTRTVIGSLGGRASGYTGTFGDDGLLHVSRGGRDWITINVDTMEITEIPGLSTATGVADITNVNGIFYGVSSSGDLVRIDPVAETVEFVAAVSGLPSHSMSYGAAWSTAGGNLYVGRNSGEIYQITGYSTSEPVATQVGVAPSTNSNDGASCELAPPPPGLADVDGPAPETAPSTPAAQDAAASYAETFVETPIVIPDPTPIAAPDPAPAGGDDVFVIDDAGIGNGDACAATVIEDRPARDADGRFVTVDTATELHRSVGVDADWAIVSGTWASTADTMAQTEDCDYDATALLTPFSVRDFRWEATVVGPASTRGGLLIGQSSPNTRSGATLVDIADDGRTVRWGSYDGRGHYVYVGGETLDTPSDGTVRLAVIVHGHDVTVEVDGAAVGSFTTREAGGHVGLVATRSQASFADIILTALPTDGIAR